MPNITKIKVNGTSYDVEDAAATQGIAGLDTALVNFQNTAGVANGLATLDSTVKVPSTQMPMAAINNYIASNTRDSVLVTTNSPSISVTSYDNIGLRVGLGLSITFLVDVTGSASTDTMTISYNGGNAIPIKVGKDGSVVNFAPNQISSTWKFVQTGVTLEVRYIENGGDTYWLIVGNPVVLSSSTDGYTIYADGYIVYNTSDYSELWAKRQNRPLNKVLPALGDTPENPTIAQIASALRARGNSENFKGLAIGDYFDLPSLGISSSGTSGSITWNSTYENLRFVIAGFNHYKGTGDTDSGSGILIIAKNVIFQHRMHSSNANDGGMAAMELRTKSSEGLNLATTAITSALGISPKTVHRLLRTQTNSNPSWAWLAEQVFIPTEVEVFGAQGFGNGVWYTGASTQYPLFAIAPQSRIAMLNGNRQWWWEATPSSHASGLFCDCDGTGYADYNYCSSTTGGVRFAFYL